MNQKLWKPIYLDDPSNVDQSYLDKIIDGSSPALIIRNFYPSYLCKKLSKKVIKVSQAYHDSFSTKIGTTLSSHINSKSDYFVEVKKNYRHFNYIFSSNEPRKRILKFLSSAFKTKNVSVAHEGNNCYSFGIVRIHDVDSICPVHRDSASFEASSFLVSKLEKQLSCVLYLQSPDAGGQLVVYNKRWNRGDEKYRNIEFGYTYRVVSNCKKHSKISPERGNLVIINPIHFHKILPVRGFRKRISLGMFLAFQKNSGGIVVWS